MPNAREFISSDEKLMVVDVVIPPGREAHFGKFIDLNMLVMTGGSERTADEFRTLLEASGFRLVRVVSSESPISILLPRQLRSGTHSAAPYEWRGKHYMGSLFLRTSRPCPTMTFSQHRQEWNSRATSPSQAVPG